MRIGIMGGTFSPLHNAHIALAKESLNQLSLDEVWFIVAGNPPHKENPCSIEAICRYDMCKNALKKYKDFKVLDNECYSLEKSYTYKTLIKLTEKHPEHSFFFIMGEDSLNTFNEWKHPEIISKHAEFAVCIRSAKDTGIVKKAKELGDKYKTVFHVLLHTYNPISSTSIRESILGGNFNKLKDQVPNEVISYIKEHRLYLPESYYDEDEIIELIRDTQKEKRFFHSIRVADTACALASNYLFPPKIAYYTGLLHDCAKHLSGDELIKFCKDRNLSLTESEIESPLLLHGLVGSHIARDKFHIDEEMAHAIEVHTRGSKNMSLLDKIIFIADYIEPGRRRSKILSEARTMAYKNLDLCIVMILEDTIAYLKETDRPIDITTSDTLDFYRKQVDLSEHI